MVTHLHSLLSRRLEFKDTGYVIIKVAYGSIGDGVSGKRVHQKILQYLVHNIELIDMNT